MRGVIGAEEEGKGVAGQQKVEGELRILRSYNLALPSVLSGTTNWTKFRWRGLISISIYVARCCVYLSNPNGSFRFCLPRRQQTPGASTT